jgi:hypothetical protein
MHRVAAYDSATHNDGNPDPIQRGRAANKFALN